MCVFKSERKWCEGSATETFPYGQPGSGQATHGGDPGLLLSKDPGPTSSISRAGARERFFPELKSESFNR